MDRHIKSLIEASNDNRLAIFVGSGISKSSETEANHMPLWKDLIFELKKDLNDVEENDYLKLAQLYFLEHGEYLYYNKLKKIFDINLEPSKIHKLIFEIKPNYVITTNWDKLLDKTIIDNACIYDIVVSDVDLVKSSVQRKLIKMHGDFEHHNIVFKEDDYLNYQKNFPLIENFIKSVLSTHTILFLGYSYSDYNLKHIMKWIQSFSTVKPPSYLVRFSNNNSEIKYLENHGIKSLILSVNNPKDNKECNSTIEELLMKIKNKSNLKKDNLTFNDIVNYFYEKLLPFDELSILMPEQVKKVLKNVYIIYDKEYIILDFNKLKKASDLYYSEFIKVLTKLDKKELENKDNLIDKLNRIFIILSKAGIGGIMINDKEYYKFECPLYNNIDISNIIDFKLEINSNHNSLQKAFIHYLLNENEDSYLLYEESVKKYMKSKNHIGLFLSMFNRNKLLLFLKYDYTVKNETYNQLEDYDMEEKYQDVPNNIRQAISPIISTFKDFNFIYGFGFTVNSLLKKKEEQKKSIENGSIVFSNNLYESELRHQNLIYFVLSNGLAIDKYDEYQTIIEYFINISIIGQIQEENISLNKLELFSCIKYIKEKNLKLIFEDYADKNNSKRLILNIDNQKYLLKAMANIVKHIREEGIKSFSSFEEDWKKIIYLFSIAKLDEETLKNILKGFYHILNTSNNSISIYKTINDFLGIQFNLYKEQISSLELINIVELILNKIIYKNYNGHELYAIKSNYISNIYGYLETDRNFNYDNKKVIEKLILEINSWEINEQVELSKYFLISLYYISNEEIKNMILSFITNIDYIKLEDNYSQIDFELFLLMHEFMEKENLSILITKINEEVSKYRDGKSMSSTMYNLQYRLKFLVENKDIKELNDLSEELTMLIKKFEEHKSKSFF